MEIKLEIEKAKAHIIVEFLEYLPNAVVCKTIIKKTTGNITATSIDQGEEIGEKINPFDVFVQVVDGAAELMIDKIRILLTLGQGIIIPAHSKHSFFANEQFKIISTIIKSGYE